MVVYIDNLVVVSSQFILTRLLLRSRLQGESVVIVTGNSDMGPPTVEKGHI